MGYLWEISRALSRQGFLTLRTERGVSLGFVEEWDIRVVTVLLIVAHHRWIREDEAGIFKEQGRCLHRWFRSPLWSLEWGKSYRSWAITIRSFYWPIDIDCIPERDSSRIALDWGFQRTVSRDMAHPVRDGGDHRVAKLFVLLRSAVRGHLPLFVVRALVFLPRPFSVAPDRTWTRSPESSWPNRRSRRRWPQQNIKNDSDPLLSAPRTTRGWERVIALESPTNW